MNAGPVPADRAGRVQRLRRLAVLTVAMTFVLMVLGAWVKATGSGLACPDWPACYGEWLPPFPSQETGGVDPSARDHADSYTQGQVMAEWTHRAVASLLGIPVLLMAVLALGGKELNPLLRLLPVGLVGLLGVQVLLGKLTVNVANAAWASTSHLATATAIVILVTAIAMLALVAPLAPPKVEAEEPAPPQPRKVAYTYPDEASRAPEAANE